VGPPTMATPAPGFRPVPARFSVGRKQPFAGDAATNVLPQFVKYQRDGDPAYPRNQPNHTFFHHNNRSNVAYPPVATDIMNSAYTGDWGSLTVSIAAATNASPIVITTTRPTNFTTGMVVNIGGVTGNTAANGSWTITVNNPTQFSLNGSTGNGAYAGGG